jgi:chemotaxis protein MotB
VLSQQVGCVREKKINLNLKYFISMICKRSEGGKMKSLVITLSAILMLLLAFGGYFYFQIHHPMAVEHRQIRENSDRLSQKVGNLESELNQKVSELARTQQEKEAEIARVKSTKDSLITEMKQEIDDNQIQITQLADKLKVSIVDKILFPSGEAQISPEGLAVLKRVGDILKKSDNKIIRVEGHTDNVPIGRKKVEFPTNWELSTARATNVVRFLQDKVQMKPELLEAVGLGEFHPVADNSTAEGRAQNRRIEITLMPLK